MRRMLLLPVALTLAGAGFVAAAPAWAGSPHFVGTPTASRTGNTLTVSGKEAGLGDEQTINIEVKATALCINGGGHHPNAVNKESVTSDTPVTVQNGKANFTATLTATFSPDCSPPMTVEFTNVTVADTTNGLFVALTGTF
jgi:hypothetical protein